RATGASGGWPPGGPGRLRHHGAERIGTRSGRDAPDVDLGPAGELVAGVGTERHELDVASSLRSPLHVLRGEGRGELALGDRGPPRLAVGGDVDAIALDRRVDLVLAPQVRHPAHLVLATEVNGDVVREAGLCRIPLGVPVGARVA